MTKNFLSYSIIIALAAAACLCSCTQDRDPCLEPTTALMHIGCYRIADTGTAALDTLLPNVNLYADSNGYHKYWYYGLKSVSKLSLLLSSTTDSNTWFLQPDSATNILDTLQFRYTRSLQFLSNGCGYTYFFNLTDVTSTHHLIDSIQITNREVNLNANATEHLKIYF